MELFNQSHFQDVRNVILRKRWGEYYYTALIHPNRSGELEMERVESIDWQCDFVNSYTSHIAATFTCTQEQYYSNIWPSRNNLEATLTKFIRHRCDPGMDTVPRRYRCIISEETGRNLDQDVVHSMETSDMNLSEYHTFNVQLVELFSEPTPFVYTEGIYIDEDREEFLRVTISHALDTIKGAPKFQYLFIDPKWDNRRNIEKALLPTHTRLNAIPHLLQKDWGGFYNRGIGSYHMLWGGTDYFENGYIKYRIWFIYPLMDITRWKRVNNHDKLIMWIVPDTNKSWDNYNHTYEWYPPRHKDPCKDDIPGQDKIMSIYVRRMKPNSEAAEHRSVVKPYGIHTIYPKEFMDIPVDVAKDGVYGSGDRLNKDIQFEKRNDGLDDFTTHYKKNTVNYQVNSTQMSKNLGKRMDFIWTHSDFELIMPGMPVRMHWEVNRQTVTVFGIILFAHTLIMGQGKNNPESGLFDAKTYISVYVLRDGHEL